MELNERLKHGIERVVLLPVRVRHRARARRKHGVRLGALATVRRTLEGASKLKSESVKTVFNVGMAVGLFPVVGITLPMFSYGGSSVVTMLIGLGLLMNVSMRR